MPRVPLLAGPRLVGAPGGEDDVVLRPPPPGEALADVAAAVREALRFPLEGPPLAELAREARRATIVVEPPALPIPGAERDPRQLAIGAAVDGLERLRVSTGCPTDPVPRGPRPGVRVWRTRRRVWAARQGYPSGAAGVERVARSPLRRLFGLAPGPLRARVLRSLPLELRAAAAFAGPPSVAHAEALLRGVELRGTELAGRLDAICIGIPRATPYLPRERPNPLLVAYLGLGLALRLWRDSFPLAPGGTAILLHRFMRHFTHPTQHPYRVFFQAARSGGPPPGEQAGGRGERGGGGHPPRPAWPPPGPLPGGGGGRPARRPARAGR